MKNFVKLLVIALIAAIIPCIGLAEEAEIVETPEVVETASVEVVPAAEETVAEETAAEETAAEETVADDEIADETASDEVPAEESAPICFEGSVEIVMENDEVWLGDVVVLKAIIANPNGAAYSLQWQVDDGAGWKDLSGETSDSLSFTVTEQNAEYAYRVVVIG